MDQVGSKNNNFLWLLIAISISQPCVADDKFHWEPYPWPHAEYPSREKPMRRDLSEPLEFGAKYPKAGNNHAVTKNKPKIVKKIPKPIVKEVIKPIPEIKKEEQHTPDTNRPVTKSTVTEKRFEWLRKYEWLIIAWIVSIISLLYIAFE